MLRLLAHNTRKMSRCSEQNGFYSDKILAGIVDLLEVCVQWAKTHFNDKLIHVTERSCVWEVVHEDVVRMVNEALFLKHEDWDFVASVWQAIYYETPKMLTVDSTPGSSYAAIYTRTASQQRISVYAFRVLIAEHARDFDMRSHLTGVSMAMPSLALLQRLQNDDDNVFICQAVGMLAGKHATTLGELAEMAPGSHILVQGMRPLAEVMLPLRYQDIQEIMRTEQCPVRFVADHAALVQMIDAHFMQEGYATYYTTESGPPVVQNMYNAAMSVLPFEPAETVPVADESDFFHFFWRRHFASGAHTDTSMSAQVARMRISLD